MQNEACRSYYEQSYAQSGFGAQRRYPNEEFMRFLGRHFSSVPQSARKDVRFLEMGCGSGANLWAVAREGFEVHGIDLSEEGLALCRAMLDAWNVTAELKAADMTACPYPDRYFDAIADVFSSYCLTEEGAAAFHNEVGRLLKPGGLFFSYIPSQASDLFTNPAPSRKIDASTLDGIRREGAPFFGNNYPFRFVTPEGFSRDLERHGFEIVYNETVGRTYNGRSEYFEFVTIVGRKV